MVMPFVPSATPLLPGKTEVTCLLGPSFFCRYSLRTLKPSYNVAKTPTATQDPANSENEEIMGLSRRQHTSPTLATKQFEMLLIKMDLKRYPIIKRPLHIQSNSSFRPISSLEISLLIFKLYDVICHFFKYLIPCPYKKMCRSKLMLPPQVMVCHF